MIHTFNIKPGQGLSLKDYWKQITQCYKSHIFNHNILVVVVYNGTTHRLVYTYTVYTHIYWIHIYWYYNGTFLAFVEAKASIMSSKLTWRDKLCSMLSVLRETSLSWPVLLRILCFYELEFVKGPFPTSNSYRQSKKYSQGNAHIRKQWG